MIQWFQLILEDVPTNILTLEYDEYTYFVTRNTMNFSENENFADAEEW